VTVLKLRADGLDALRALLREGSFHLEQRPHAHFLARREGVTLTAYRSGKLNITGPQAEEYAGVLVGKGIADRTQATPDGPVARAALTLHFDGLCGPMNPGGVAAYGFVVRRDGRVLHEGHGLAAPPGPGATNNVAEYAALIGGLRWLLERRMQDEPVSVLGDSSLIVKQVQGEYRVTAGHLKPLHEEAMRLLKRFPHAQIEWVPREENADADALSRAGYREAVRAHPEWKMPPDV
jgi:ribonuclease HI